MKILSKKKKGVTLLEIVISLAILAIVSVPVGQMLITAVRTSKNAENKQQAMLIGKNVLEEIRAVNINNGKELTGAGTLKQVMDDSTPAKPVNPMIFNNYLENGDKYVDKNGFEIDVELIENKSIEFSQVQELEFDGEISIETLPGAESNTIKITTNDTSDIEYTQLVSEPITILNKSDKVVLSDSIPVVNIQKKVKDSDDNADGHIAINLDENFSSTITIKIDQDEGISRPLNIYVRKSNKSTGIVQIEADNQNVLFNHYRLELNNADKMGKMFEVKVVVKKNDSILFTGNGYKNIGGE